MHDFLKLTTQDGEETYPQISLIRKIQGVPQMNTTMIHFSKDDFMFVKENLKTVLKQIHFYNDENRRFYANCTSKEK